MSNENQTGSQSSSFWGYYSMEKTDSRIVSLEEAHTQYAGLLFDKCVRILGDPTEAEDAVQEVFLLAFRSWESFSYGQSRLPWLYRIATNVCLKFLRTQRRKGPTYVKDMEAFGLKPKDQVEVIQSRRVLQQILDNLDERGQQILIAHFVDGMDQVEIAASLGISRRAVVKRLTALRAQFEHFGKGTDHV